MTRRLSAQTIRNGMPEDLGAVLELWALADAQASVTDTIESLRGLLAVDPQALLLSDSQGQVVGSLIAAWNGWRGSFYRLAIHPERRRRGLATLLVREGERRLRERGALRLDAIVAVEDSAAMHFWLAVGYEQQLDRSRFVRNL
jgi:ribosomal protein S18 acetylase RimI-like enzyme